MADGTTAVPRESSDASIRQPVLLVVDGHAYAYRAYHAIRHLARPDGKPTNAIFGFIKMLVRMRQAVAPSHLVVVWDGGLAAERIALLPEYKAQRPSMPVDLASQIDEIAGYLHAAGICSLRREGVEADDWIASLSRRAAGAGVRVVIASADKDFMQLVSDHIGILNPNDRGERIWSAAEVREKTGVAPGQVVDWLSLMGDASDNIPGVTGVGPKRAAELLQRYGSIDELYRQLGDLPAQIMRHSLESAENQVRRNQKLVRLLEDLEDGFALDRYAPKPEDVSSLKTLYQEWGFRSMAESLSDPRDRQAELFVLNGN